MLGALLAQVVDNTVGSKSGLQRSAEILVQVGVVAAAIGAIAAAILAVVRLGKWLEEVRFVGRIVMPIRWTFRKLIADPCRWLWRTSVKDPVRRFIRAEVAHAIEPPTAELRGEIIETQKRVAISERKIRAELATHTDEEQMFAAQLVRAVVAAGAARESDLRQRRRDDPAPESP